MLYDIPFHLAVDNDTVVMLRVLKILYVVLCFFLPFNNQGSVKIDIVRYVCSIKEAC